MGIIDYIIKIVGGALTFGLLIIAFRSTKLKFRSYDVRQLAKKVMHVSRYPRGN